MLTDQENRPARPVSGAAGPEWRLATGPVDYAAAVAAMEARVEAIRAGQAPELVWLLEHPPVYTAGTSADPAELLDPRGIPVHQTGRGGRHTYHGPGQRIAYVLLDLRARGQDVRRYVHALEEWAILALRRLGVESGRREGRIGIWVDRGPGRDGRREDKIAALGVRVRGWVTFHGLAINVNPDLAAFAGIVPCGISEQRYGVTSLAALGVKADMPALDRALRETFDQAFGR
ncbi:MAG: lipoyl(octanoyl) transferase LipB [Alphaproteobacteria bacterium]|nr:lipoyl(octanoyl) transferase LipB [Alphaproteobacteria bacterium]